MLLRVFARALPLSRCIGSALTTRSPQIILMPKRKRSSVAGAAASNSSVLATPDQHPVAPRKPSGRKSQPTPAVIDPNPDTNSAVKDGQEALRASPDAASREPQPPKKKIRAKKAGNVNASEVAVKTESSPPPPESIDLSAQPSPADVQSTVKKPRAHNDSAGDAGDPERDDDDLADPEELKEALSKPPPVNSSYLPLPWKGRLGYACLNTYLRTATPPVFCSRTCRMASIVEHRHPLKDPSQPEHATKNRPDKEQPADVARGQAFVEGLALANVRDIVKMLRWNDRYGIKFLRLSSEMFPFASHQDHGYKLAPFASEALAEAGKVAAELGHRLTTHPGQFTQLGSPRKEVVTASYRDLDYHCELLDLLKLPPQQDRDAVMILHMGGVFGDKAATIQRFRENYEKVSPGVKKRLVLENDDVCYTVHDLLPVCEELNIPMVLDYHHHNLLFDADKIREGTQDIMGLYDRIKATWTRKGITQKMHYSEPTPAAITSRQGRKHSPRVATLPPCAPDMDLMIEAKDKEQAVFELMRIFKLPGFETFSNVLPYIRNDENKPWKPPKKATPKKKKDAEATLDPGPEAKPPPVVPESEIAMGGEDGRVYWPPTMEEWLRPKKREVKPKGPPKIQTLAEKVALKRAEKAAKEADGGVNKSEEVEESVLTPKSEALDDGTPKFKVEDIKATISKPKAVRAPKAGKSRKKAAAVPTPSTSDDNEDEELDGELSDFSDDEEPPPTKRTGGKRAAVSRAPSGRTTSRAKKPVNYVEDD